MEISFKQIENNFLYLWRKQFQALIFLAVSLAFNDWALSPAHCRFTTENERHRRLLRQYSPSFPLPKRGWGGKKQSRQEPLKRLTKKLWKDADVYLFKAGCFWWGGSGGGWDWTQLSLWGWSLGVCPCSNEYMGNTNWTWYFFVFLGGGHSGGRVDLGGVESVIRVHCMKCPNN